MVVASISVNHGVTDVATALDMSEVIARNEALALTAYWFKRGYWGIRTWIVPTADGYVLQSNVGAGGFPPK
jgi:hypothetical protein